VSEISALAKTPHGGSRLSFNTASPAEGFIIEVESEGRWRAVTERSFLVSGQSFDLAPDSIEKVGETLRLEGHKTTGPGAGYAWIGAITPVPGTGWFHIEVDIDSGGFAIAADGPFEPELRLGLGPLPPYERGDHVWFKTVVENPAQWNHEARGNDFPATYYYDPYLKAELMMFFDMTAMSWMGTDTLARFYDYKCGFRRKLASVGAGLGAVAELGLLAATQTGHSFPAGSQRFSWYVAARHLDDEPAPPTEQEALIRLVDASLPLTRASGNRWPDRSLSWADAADGVAGDLMNTEHCWGTDELGEHLFGYVDGRSDAWVSAMSARGRTFVGTGPVLESALWALRPLDVVQKWIPSAGYAALTTRLERFVRSELLAPRSGMLTGRASRPTPVGTWQYVYMIAESWFIYAGREDQDLLDRVRAEIDEVLIPLAANVQYNFPLQFDKENLRKIGPGNNIAVCGTYALLMIELSEGGRVGGYLDEAQRALRALANVPIDDALQEVFLIAHAIDAAERLHSITGDGQWLELRQYFRAQTLRMMYWYDDRTSSLTSTVDHLGMFQACANINYPAFFENLEVDARLAGALPGEADPGPLLKVIDYGRRNNFSFLPKCSPDLFGPMPLDYIPFEEVPILDGPLNAGFVGQEIYGAGWAFRAHLLWDAYAVSSDREIMVVNVDSYREPESGAWRGTFFVYNGSVQARSTSLTFPVLGDGGTAAIRLGEAAAVTVTGAEGVPVTLATAEWQVLTVTRR
jgi:hypothetical protein